MILVLSMFAFLLIGAIALYCVARGQRQAASARTLSPDQTAMSVIAMTADTSAASSAAAAPCAPAVDCGGSAGSSCGGS
jgi:hypothetical protein